VRVVVTMVAEAFVFGFFILLAWVGYTVLEILAYDDLVSMPGVSVAYAQSVIPISAVLFIIAEAMSLPEIIRKARRP
jgi:TRAP-type C4-dicarboxylate transport system permease small subunit